DFAAPLSQAGGLGGPISNYPSPQRSRSAPVAVASPVGSDVHHGDSGPYAPVSAAQECPDQTGRKPDAVVGADNWFALFLPARARCLSSLPKSPTTRPAVATARRRTASAWAAASTTSGCSSRTRRRSSPTTAPPPAMTTASAARPRPPAAGENFSRRG